MKQIKYYLPLIIGVIITIVLFSSCVATKKQKRNFLSKYCERKDSISVVTKDSSVYRDTTIYKSIPGPVQYLENPCKLLCDSLGNLKNFTPITKKENGSRGTIFKVGNSIALKCDIDSVEVHLAWIENHKSKVVFSHTENRIEKPCELEHRTKWDGFTWYWFIITASLLVLWILIKVFKGYLKVWFPFLAKFM